MVLVVETGAGISGANSYVGLDDADTHFSGLPNVAWNSATPQQREYALKTASQYVDFYDYPGTPKSEMQSLKWPRVNVQGVDGRAIGPLPMAVITAVLELASSMVGLSVSQMNTGQVTREKVGHLELVYDRSVRKPSFVFRLLSKVGARATGYTTKRG
jgi:Putative DnaT-like ssDNA binding protein